jgi:hypothetical protein
LKNKSATKTTKNSGKRKREVLEENTATRTEKTPFSKSSYSKKLADAVKYPKFKGSSLVGFGINMTKHFDEKKSCLCGYTFTSKTDVKEHIREFHTK